MANAFTCGGEWTDPEFDPCIQFPSGMSDAIVLRKGTKLSDLIDDGDSDKLDKDKIEQLIQQGDAIQFFGLRITLEAPSEQTSDSFEACTPDTVNTYDRTGSWQDRKVSLTNIRSYNSINASTGFVAGGVLVKECAADRIMHIDANVNFVGGRVSGADDEIQHFEYEMRWKHKGDPLSYPMVDDIFDRPEVSPVSP